MQVAFPTSIPTIRKVDSTSVFVGFDALLNQSEYVRELHEKKRKGARLVQFGGLVDGLDADIVIRWDQIVSPILNKDWIRRYAEACDSDSPIVAIAAGTDEGLSRITYLKKLVDAGLFYPEKSYWLYGVPNPAELGVYSTLFSNFVSRKIDLAVCSTCFIYSAFGIKFSSDTGVMQRMEEVNDTRLADLGLHGWESYEMSQEQTRCFYMNAEMVHAFAGGNTAGAYMDRVHGTLEEGVV